MTPVSAVGVWAGACTVAVQTVAVAAATMASTAEVRTAVNAAVTAIGIAAVQTVFIVLTATGMAAALIPRPSCRRASDIQPVAVPAVRCFPLWHPLSMIGMAASM